MKFSQAHVKDAFERSALKLALIGLSVISLTFSILLGLDLSKAPLIIERACETNLLEVSSTSQSQEEVLAFMREAVGLRFDSTVSRDPSAFMVQDLFAARSKEQDELKRGAVDQRLIVRSIRFEKDHFTIEADRLVAVGKARSAIPITLTARISSKNRSLSNPYGLVLTSIEQIREGKPND